MLHFDLFPNALAKTTHTVVATASTTASPHTAQGGSWSNSLFLLALLGLFMYFVLWRPQSKRLKAHQKMINALQVGDEIITAGGLLGKISQLDNMILSVELAENLMVKIQKSAVSAVLPKGTIK
jgi:preprotein translocase subunit YajC